LWNILFLFDRPREIIWTTIFIHKERNSDVSNSQYVSFTLHGLSGIVDLKIICWLQRWRNQVLTYISYLKHNTFYNMNIKQIEIYFFYFQKLKHRNFGAFCCFVCQFPFSLGIIHKTWIGAILDWAMFIQTEL
jgi:hypothetical protein